MKPLCYFIFGLLSGMIAIVYMVPYRSAEIQIPLTIPAPKAVGYVGLDGMQLDCMAQNIFYEARGESIKGKEMVGMVVMERVKSPHFPKTICGVVKQANHTASGRVIRNQCQFSWYCDGHNHAIHFDSGAVQQEWAESYAIAKKVMNNKVKLKIDMKGVTHYHAGRVNPFWARDHKDYKLVARIGHHLFYRWKKATLPKWKSPQELAQN